MSPPTQDPGDPNQEYSTMLNFGMLLLVEIDHVTQ